MKKIVLTGGGTAGHVTPNIALLPYLKNKNIEVHYIGSKSGIEKDLIVQCGIPYYPIATGKLRRYWSIKNLTDPFRVIKGLGDSIAILKKIKPDAVFSKGGFVAVPVIIAAKILGIPSVIHESDMTPGLANKISIPFSSKICTTFSETINYLPKNKAVHTGTPIRKELLEGSKEEGLKIAGFTKEKPVLMMMGGSLGSVKINKVLREALPQLLQSYQVIHLCGKNNKDQSLQNTKGYLQLEYAHGELPHLLAATDLIISRAGANSISEFLALGKPQILIPLSIGASRGDQILNAKSFKEKGYCYLLEEENLSKQSLIDAVCQVYKEKEKYKQAMSQATAADGIHNVLKEIEKAMNKNHLATH